MASACLFIGFDRPVQGREEEAYATIMGEATERFESWKKEGYCESFQPVALTPHGGNLNFCFIVNGERAKLDELRRTDGFEALSMKLNRCFQGYGVVPGVTGEGLAKVAQRNPQYFKKS